MNKPIANLAGAVRMGSGQVVPGDATASSKRPRTIQSLDRALNLIDLLVAAKAGLPLNVLATRAGLNVSTCHHLLATLQARGYVSQNPRTRAYALGARITELSNARLKQFNLIDIAMPELERLNEVTSESVHLAVMQGRALVTLAKLNSRLPVGVGSDETGKSNAAHATATGKAILAWLPEIEIERVLADSGLLRFTEKTICIRPELIEDLRLVRRNGYALDDEEFQPGVVCVGSAIRDHAGAVIGSVSCSMPKMRAREKALTQVKSAVKHCATAISERLGGPKDGTDPSGK
jgi:IclR family acetate operon transcriptional repressor